VIYLSADPGLLSTDLLISSDTVLTNKYENSWLENKDDTPVARLAEFLLMRAEALVRIEGVNQESLDLLNQVRKRSIRIIDGNLEEIPFGSNLISFGLADFIASEDFIEAVILEEQVELAFEGNRFHDLMRLK